jgi:hypothetical protein
MKLTQEPARELTDRECAKLLGGMIGGLLTVSSAENVIRALAWWTGREDQVKQMKEFTKAFGRE